MSYERMFGCDVSVIDEAIEDWLSKPRRGGTKAMAYSMLSDVQELLSMGASSETIRMKINKVKYVLDFDKDFDSAKKHQLAWLLEKLQTESKLSHAINLLSEKDLVKYQEWLESYEATEVKL